MPLSWLTRLFIGGSVTEKWNLFWVLNNEIKIAKPSGSFRFAAEVPVVVAGALVFFDRMEEPLLE